jgi:hypothetical protein
VRAVNLLPVEDRSRRLKAPNGALVAGAAAIVVAGGAVAGLSSFARGDVVDRERELAAVRELLEKTPKPVAEDPLNVTLVKEKNERITALAGALGGRLAFDRLLRELSLILPGDVWLSQMTATTFADVAAAEAAAAQTTGAPEGQGAAPAAASQPAPADGSPPFLLAGYTYSQEGVARLLARLSVIPYLDQVRLERSAFTEVAKRRIVEFRIVANLRTPETFE